MKGKKTIIKAVKTSADYLLTTFKNTNNSEVEKTIKFLLNAALNDVDDETIKEIVTPWRFQWFNGVRYVREEKTGYFRRHTSRSENGRPFMHRDVWTFYNGEIPDGYEIHHKDFQKHNNDISNLQMLTPEEHQRIHFEQDKLLRVKRECICVNCGKTFTTTNLNLEEGTFYCSPKCKKDWRYKNKIDFEERICDCCGKTFEVWKYSKTRFCSPKCVAIANK